MAVSSRALLRGIAVAFALAEAGAGADASCPDRPPAFFEQQKYVVREARIVLPFIPERLTRAFLPEARARLPAAGQPFTVRSYESARAALRAEIKKLDAGFDSPISLTVIGAGFSRCDETASPKQMDVVYLVGTTKLPSIFTNARTSFAVEVPETLDPNKESVLRHFSIVPLFGFNETDRFFGGGKAALNGALPGLSRFTAEGRGSSAASAFNAVAGGGRDFEEGWLRRMDWALDYNFANRPAGGDDLRTGNLMARFSARTAAFGPREALFAFGGAAGGGNSQTSLNQAVLPQGLLASAGMAGLKAYAGSQFVLGRTLVNATYGLQAAGVRQGRTVDFTKHLADVSADSTFLLPGRAMDHRPVSVEARFGAGVIAGSGAVPVAERFFGGNGETVFLPGSDWTMRSNPVIRSFAANRLGRAGEAVGVGGDAFTSLNLTLAVPFVRKPLVPREVSESPDFKEQAEGQFAGAEKVLGVAYNRPKPAYARLTALAATLDETLEALAGITGIPQEVEEKRQECNDLADDLKGTVEAIEKESLAFLVREDEDRSIPAVRACLDALNEKVNNAKLKEAGAALDGHREFIAAELERGRPAAEAQAQADVAYSSRIFYRVVKEMNVYSVSPMVVFDAARLWPGTGAAEGAGNRYGIGGGLRVSIANSFHVHFGYAANPNRRNGEARGAFFFGMTVRDPLR